MKIILKMMILMWLVPIPNRDYWYDNDDDKNEGRSIDQNKNYEDCEEYYDAYNEERRAPRKKRG